MLPTCLETLTCGTEQTFFLPSWACKPSSDSNTSTRVLGVGSPGFGDLLGDIPELSTQSKISPGQRCVGRSQGLWACISGALPSGVIQDLPNSPARSNDNMHEVSPPPPQGVCQRSAPRVFIGAMSCGQPLPGLYQNSRPPGRVGVQHKP